MIEYDNLLRNSSVCNPQSESIPLHIFIDDDSQVACVRDRIK